MPPWVPVTIYLLGFVAEVWGLFLMSHRYLKETQARDLPRLWLSALFGGPHVRGAARTVRLGAEGEAPENLNALRGLALIAVGFLLQAVVTVWTMLDGPQ